MIAETGLKPVSTKILQIAQVGLRYETQRVLSGLTQPTKK
jgi:hypothetical protein